MMKRCALVVIFCLFCVALSACSLSGEASSAASEKPAASEGSASSEERGSAAEPEGAWIGALHHRVNQKFFLHFSHR